MSFSRYSIEKKQISRDRGVTWEDVTPSETRQGKLVGVARTLIECEDMDCDLEKDEYYLVDGVLPNEICANYIKTIPFGILSNITFTDGAYCCNDWADAGSYVTNLFGERISQPTGKRICGGGYCPGWGYYNDVNIYGFQMELGSGKVCYVDLNTCIRINSFMSWAEGKETWKLIYKQHYVRERCSKDWVADGDEELFGIGERWIRESEDFNNEYWRHQYASEFDESGNVVTWSNAELETRQMTEYTLPSEIELIDYIKNDGVACATMSSPLPTTYHTEISLDGNLTPSGITYSSMWRYVNDYVYSDYRAVYHDGYDEPGYYIDSYIADPTTWQDIVQKLTNTFERITYSGRIENQRLFAKLWVDSTQSGNKVLDPSDMAYGMRHRKLYKLGHSNLSGSTIADLEKTDCTTIAFPYHIPENNGYQGDDAYYNISEVGYILRDGTKLVLETIMGSYINTNDVRKPLASNTPSSLVPTPSDAVNITLNSRCTSIPSDAFKGNTVLTAITMADNIYVGNNAFSGTTNLQSVTFGRNTTLGERVFEDSHIRSIDLTNVISMGFRSFFNSSLESLTIGNSLTSIPEQAFYGCSSLRGALVIPSRITSVGDAAFEACTGITSVTLNEGLRTIGQFSFYGMSITEITIPRSVTSYGYSGAFEYCSKLEKVAIKTTAGITQKTFYGCNVKELTLVVTTPPSYGDSAFSFASDAVILVPASAVDTYKTTNRWRDRSSMIHPIPTETEWVNIGYACVDGQRYDYEHKRGRNTAYSNDWFWLPEYRTVGEPYGECDGTEPY